MLTLTILGNNGPYAGPGGACSGYLIRSGSVNVLVDCGPGIMSRLTQHIDFRTLDAVFISHFHPDHYSDFLTMRYALYYAAAGGQMQQRVSLVIPQEGSDEFIRDCIGIQYASLLQIVTADDGSVVHVGGGDGLYFRMVGMRHALPSLGMMVSEGRLPSAAGPGSRAPLGYTSDTGQCDGLNFLAEHASTLLCEASMIESDLSGRGAGHLSALEAGEVAARAGVETLILTHLHPENPTEVTAAEGGSGFGSKVEIAVPGKTYML